MFMVPRSDCFLCAGSGVYKQDSSLSCQLTAKTFASSLDELSVPLASRIKFSGVPTGDGEKQKHTAGERREDGRKN